MTVTALDRALVNGDAGQVSHREPRRPDPEVPERARRRTFTAQYKGPSYRTGTAPSPAP
jgi:transposase